MKPPISRQVHAVYGIRYCYGFQSAEDSVNRADDSDKDTQDNDGLELGNAEDTGQIENVFKHQRTGVKDYRDLHEQIQNNVSDGEPQRWVGRSARRAAAGWW